MKVKEALAYEHEAPPGFEVWKPVHGFEGLYEVSNFGNVRRIMRYGRPWVRLCRPKVTKDGYYESTLVKDGKPKSIRTHRLVATAFCENPHNKPEVNHIDGNKLNNKDENLEWVTSSENQKHAYALGLQKVSGGALSNRKKVRCIELDITTDSLNDMQRVLCARGYTNSTRLNALSTAINKQNPAKYLGLHFELIGGVIFL